MAMRVGLRLFKSSTNVCTVSPMSNSSIAYGIVPTQYVKQTTVEQSNRSTKTEGKWNGTLTLYCHTL